MRRSRRKSTEESLLATLVSAVCLGDLQKLDMVVLRVTIIAAKANSAKSRGGGNV